MLHHPVRVVLVMWMVLRVALKRWRSRHIVDVDSGPVVVQVVFEFKVFDAAVGIAMRDQKEDARAGRQESSALLDDAKNIESRPCSTKDGIKAPLANDQVEGAVLERQRLGDIRMQPLHGLHAWREEAVPIEGRTVLGAHLIDHHLREVHVDDSTRPPVPLHVFPEGCVPAAQNERPTLLPRREQAEGCVGWMEQRRRCDATFHGRSMLHPGRDSDTTASSKGTTRGHSQRLISLRREADRVQ
jgi:hypothetical protein